MEKRVERNKELYGENKMKVIDLLNKIANGEEVPKRFLFQNNEYYSNEEDEGMYYIVGTNTTIYQMIMDCDLHENIEVIEEPKKIENVSLHFGNVEEIKDKWVKVQTKKINDNLSILENRLNEIIDYINEVK